MALNTLAMTAVGFAAENIMATIVGNVGEQVFHQARQGVVDALREGGRPVNHELQRAVRKAYLQATLYVCERCGDKLKVKLSVGAQITRSFTREIKALEVLSRHIGEELQQVADAVYRLPPNEADKQSELLLQPAGVAQKIADLRANLRDTLLAELREHEEVRRLGGLSPRFVQMIEQGWQERGADDELIDLCWFDLLCAFFAHELKSNPAVRDIFASKALAQLLVNGQALTVSNIEARLAAQGGLVSQRLASVNAQLETLNLSQQKGVAAVLQALSVQEAWLEKLNLSQKEGFAAVLRVLGVQDERLERLNLSQQESFAAVLEALNQILQEIRAVNRAPTAPEPVEGANLAGSAAARLAQMPVFASYEKQPLPEPSQKIRVNVPQTSEVSKTSEVFPHEKPPLPPIQPLPPGSRMPFHAYAHFVGRVNELQRLATILKGPQGAAAIGQMVAATGLGGIGKTQLAVEFSHRYGYYFAGGVFWLDFSAPSGIESEVARCGGAEGMTLLPNFAQLPLPEQAALVKRAWQEPIPRLLIFDNCEEEELVDQWRPTTGGCRVLITSRRGEWDSGRGIEQVRLSTLTPDESVYLLGKLALRLTKAEKIAIANELGHFPLALHLAGSFLKRYKRVSIERYLRELTDEPLLHHASMTGRGSNYSPTQHERHVARTFALSWQKLDKNDTIDQLAQQILLHAAYFAPTVPISLDLLHFTLPENEQFAAYDYDDAHYRLLELGLLEQEPTGVIIHRLVAAFAQMDPQSHDARQQTEQALLDEARRLNKAGYPAPLLAWQAHLRHLTDATQQREDEIAANLCNEMGFHLNMIGDYIGSISYMERALAIRMKVLGDEHPDTALSLNNLGFLSQAQGDYESARPYYERALAINEKVLGDQHPDTARSLNNLGYLLRAQGDYESARPYYERALAINEKVLGDQHPDTARSLNNLAGLFYAQGDYESARPYYERALAINEKVLGDQHPDTALSLNNLGALFDTQGDYESARPYYERALAIFVQRLGPDHPNTKVVRGNLQALEGMMGDGERGTGDG